MSGTAPAPMVCQWPRHGDCQNEVVAKIGLPSRNAIWVCREAFEEWQGGATPIGEIRATIERKIPRRLARVVPEVTGPTTEKLIKDIRDRMDAQGPPWGNPKLLAKQVEQGYEAGYEALALAERLMKERRG